MTDLVEELQSGQSTVTQLVQCGEEAGLLRREGSPDDGRVSYVRLTDDGERRLMDTFVALRADREALVQAFWQAGARFRASLRS